MATPQALKEAGLEFEYQDAGQRLVVSDIDPAATNIRNRGGEALASFLSANRQIKALDIRKAGISDNGIGHICLVLRQTDQLEELSLSPVGHAGLEFLMGVVHRCSRLQTLRISVLDVRTLESAAKNVVPGDHDTSAFAGLKKAEGEEEEEEEEEAQPEGDEDEEPEERERKKLEKLRKLLSENDYDSGDEASKSDGGALPSQVGISAALLQLLTDFATVVRKKENLLDIECNGDVVPADLQTDLARSVKDHCEQRQRRMQSRQERGARTAFDALKDQMEELRATVEGGGSASAAGALALGSLPGEEGDSDMTRLGMRAFIGRRLFAALGEALFECQRFKSKENEAVATWQGECAFLAMYIRKMAKEGGAGR
mmetsp:Transcript_146436/g.380673  ORF Transcript_146436/g.380673 Transcript_146436/m.380673 type:complete len:372 (+) Transcript_146436:48-1163(+)